MQPRRRATIANVVCLDGLIEAVCPVDERAPWKAVKTDMDHAAETLATALNVINSLKALLYPVLPFSTAQLHEDLGLGDDIHEHGWTYREIPAGTRLAPARPLYAKIETEPAGATA